MASSDSRSLSTTLYRSRTSATDVHSAAEATVHSSLSCDPPSALSTSSRDTSHPPTKEPFSFPTTPDSVVEPDLSKAEDDKSPIIIPLVSSRTTSRTREQLHLAEERLEKLRLAMENEMAKAAEMRHRAEEERAIVERLKREGDFPTVSITEAKRRVYELEQDEREASAEVPRGSTTGLFKAVCSTDLLFLIDTTGSMSGYIDAAKNQVRSVIKEIEEALLDQVEVRVAVVGYKDHGDSPNIQFLDFTPSTDQVRSFLDGLAATGGNDAPEDVLGGIQRALSATWMHRTRCIIHIADAPPHGRTLHDLGDSSDSYANPGSEPHGLTHPPLLKQMIKLQINYALLRINNSTDRMAFVFLQEYAAASAHCTLLMTNKYFSQACSLTSRNDNSGLLFQEHELGVTFSALQHLVVKAVTASVSRTASRNADLMKRARTGKKAGLTSLDAIEEDEDPVPDVQLGTFSPRWDKLGWFNETFEVEGFSHDVLVHGANTLNAMMAHDDNISLSVLQLAIHRRREAFAQGAMRVAYYARTAASTNRYVVKSFKQGGSRLACLATDMRCQTLCKSFALEFNALVENKHAIDFIVTACFKSKEGGTLSDACISLEPFLEGTYVKYNNNAGYVNEDIPDDLSNQAAQAFSHFTFERSRGRFLVCDMQGVGNLMTDPVVHTLDPERFILSLTNLGEDGFKFFFTSHKCNDVCRKLGLKSSASMIASGKYEFRETWPTMADTICCSNKLCGKILRRTSAKESAKFPGYYWCDVCWPQLQLFTVKWICIGSGPHHEFEESRFFYESQGRGTPRKCPAHREEDMRAPAGSGAGSRRVFHEPSRGSTFALNLSEPRREKTSREDMHTLSSETASSRKDATKRRNATVGHKSVPSTEVGKLWAELKSATVGLKKV